MAKYIFTNDHKITVHARVERGISRLINGNGLCAKNNMIERQGSWLNDLRPTDQKLIEFIEYKEWRRCSINAVETPLSVQNFFKTRGQAKTVYSGNLEKLRFAVRSMEIVDVLRFHGGLKYVNRRCFNRSLQKAFADNNVRWLSLLFEAYTGQSRKILSAKEKASLKFALQHMFEEM